MYCECVKSVLGCFVQELKADGPHPRDYTQTPTDYRHTYNHLRLVMVVQTGELWQTNTQTHGRTDGCYQVHYHPASRSIKTGGLTSTSQRNNRKKLSNISGQHNLCLFLHYFCLLLSLDGAREESHVQLFIPRGVSCTTIYPPLYLLTSNSWLLIGQWQVYVSWHTSRTRCISLLGGVCQFSKI